MKPISRSFPQSARRALDNAVLQGALSSTGHRFRDARTKAVAELPEFQSLRDAGAAIKDHTLAHLDLYLEHFTKAVQAGDGRVHLCATAEEAVSTVVAICRKHGVETVTKGKTMLGEEIAINDALEAAGIEPVETDLGEYILQLSGEPPSHMIGPALHKTRAEITNLFENHHRRHGFDREEKAEQLVAQGRAVLRDRYRAAGAAITGANFLIAETGSMALVTNEGNGDMARLLAPVHIAVAGIEKLVPTLEDATVLMRLLGRSATGQEMASYTTFVSPPAAGGGRPDRQFHVVLVDNGRSGLLGGSKQALLRCLRCGACQNHCPVYGTVGGHAYGWVYSGPIGAALDPVLIGLEQSYHLPQASSLCGACEAACPVAIPLPSIFRQWRTESFERRLGNRRERWGLAIWAWLAKRPFAYRLATGLAARMLDRAWIRRCLRQVPGMAGWGRDRTFPTSEKSTYFGRRTR